MRYYELEESTGKVEWDTAPPWSDVLIWIDVSKLKASWKNDPDNYMDGPDHPNAIGKRYDRFGQWLELGLPVKPAEVSLNYAGEVTFTNGRHRFSWLANHGMTKMPVFVPRSEAEEIQRRFGAG